MFARWRECSWNFNAISNLHFTITNHISTIIYRLKTIQVILFVVHFHFIALFAQNLCTKIYMQVEYQILIAKLLTPDGKRTTVYEQESSAIADKPVRHENLPKICSNSTCLQRCRWRYWPIFICLAVVASEICEIPRNTQKIQTYVRVQGHPRSSILVSIESPYVTSY